MDTQITAAIMEVVKIATSIANPIAILCVVAMGIYLIVGHDDQTIRQVKKWAIAIVIGLIIINMASPLVAWIQTIQ